MNYPCILAEFFNYLECNKTSKTTITAYGYDLTLFLKFMKNRQLEVKSINLETVNISDIDICFLEKILFPDILAYIQFITKERNNGVAAIKRKVSSLKAFYYYLVNEKRCLHINPCKDLDINLNTLKPISQHDTKMINHLVKNITGRHQYRDQAIILLFLNCAFRLKELVNIKLEDLNIEQGIIIVKDIPNEDRHISLNMECKNIISEYINKERCKSSSPYLFLSQKKKQISPRTVQHLIKTHGSALSSINGISSRTLRNTAARNIYEKEGIDILQLQKRLGLKSIAGTEKYIQIPLSRKIKG